VHVVFDADEAHPGVKCPAQGEVNLGGPVKVAFDGGSSEYGARS